MATQTQHLFTLEEYLERERKAQEKSEYSAGEIYLRPGGTPIHSRLCARVIAMFDRRLDSCKVFDSNLKVFIDESQHCVYPDAMVLCGTTEYQNSRKDVIYKSDGSV